MPWPSVNQSAPSPAATYYNTLAPILRPVADRLNAMPCVLDWDGATYGQKLQAALDANVGPLFTGPPANYAIAEQITCPVGEGGGLYAMPGKRKTRLAFTYAGAGYQMTLGSLANRILEWSFENVYIFSTGQKFLHQNVRGLQFRNVVGAGRTFVTLGMTGAADHAYICQFDEYCEFSQAAGTVAGDHFIIAENFAGQFVSSGFFEGASVPGADGFHNPGNAIDLDHYIMGDGYFSRFDNNHNLTGGHVANVFFTGHMSEGGITSALALDDYNNVQITGCLFDAAGWPVNVTRTIAGTSVRLIVNGINCPGNGGGSPAVLSQYGIVNIDASGSAAAKCEIIEIDGVGGDTTPALANTYDAVRILGRNDVNTLNIVAVDNVTVRALGNSWRTGVYISGTLNTRVNIGGQVVTQNAVNAVNDASNVAARSPLNFLRLGTNPNFGTVGALGVTTVFAALTGMSASVSNINLTIRSGSFPGITLYAQPAAGGFNISAQNNTGAPIVVNAGYVVDLIGMVF